MSRRTPPSVPGLTGAIYRNGGLLFLAFFVLVFVAFYSSYYGILSRPLPKSIHFHGITMTLWCLMLISQALLIRYRNYAMHRFVGKASYLIVPLILITGAHLSHQTVLGAAGRPDLYYHLIALMFNALIVFALFYGLAMWHRKKPMTHARYMVCTVFPLVTPVTDRIIHKYVHGVVPHLPVIGGAPIAPIVGYTIADLIVLGLLIWDWRTHKRLDVFPLALGILVVYHLSAMTWYRSELWRTVGDWIMRLPLS